MAANSVTITIPNPDDEGYQDSDRATVTFSDGEQERTFPLGTNAEVLFMRWTEMLDFTPLSEAAEAG